MLEQVFVDKGLFAVLAATEEEDVDFFHMFSSASPQLYQACVVVAPLGALEQGEDVAAVAIDVHQVRVEPTDCEGFLAWGHVPLLRFPVGLGPAASH